MKKKKKITIPRSVKDLKLSPKKLAKKHGIRINKHMPKKEKKYYNKEIWKLYRHHATEGLDRAAEILIENNPEDKKLNKVHKAIEKIITNNRAMKEINKEYNKHPKKYPHIKYLTRFLLNHIEYYAREDISESEKSKGSKIDFEGVIKFCEKILKKQIKYYTKRGIDEANAFRLASVAPSVKVFTGSHFYYRRLITELFDIAKGSKEPLDLSIIIPSIIKIEKKCKLSKKEFLDKFFYVYILRRKSNYDSKFTSNQKDLRDNLDRMALEYMDSMKPRKLKRFVKDFIKQRKRDDEKTNSKDSPRMIDFSKHATSNSPYLNIKAVVEEINKNDPEDSIYLKNG